MSENTSNKPFHHSGSKYLREITGIVIDEDGTERFVKSFVDTYAVMEAFAVICPARQHAIKKLLCTGLRGKGDVLQDLRETGDAITRGIQMEKSRGEIRNGRK